MGIEHELFEAAKGLIEQRYPVGWGGAAAIALEDGRTLTSVAPEVENNALSLCIEVGAFLEANKLNLTVTHSLCIVRNDESSEFVFLSPCGICQERLLYWGSDVLVAITNERNELVFKPLKELICHHWSIAYGKKL